MDQSRTTSGPGTNGPGTKNGPRTKDGPRPKAQGPRTKPRVAITVGDPSGIGPEIAAGAAADPHVLEVCEPVLFGPPPDAAFTPGALSAEAGRASYEAIVRAVEAAQRGEVAAVATAPINKEAFR